MLLSDACPPPRLGVAAEDLCAGIDGPCGHNCHCPIILKQDVLSKFNIDFSHLEEVSGVWKTTGVNQRRHQIQAPTRHSPAACALKCVGVKYPADCLNLQL